MCGNSNTNDMNIANFKAPRTFGLPQFMSIVIKKNSQLRDGNRKRIYLGVIKDFPAKTFDALRRCIRVQC